MAIRLGWDPLVQFYGLSSGIVRCFYSGRGSFLLMRYRDRASCSAVKWTCMLANETPELQAANYANGTRLSVWRIQAR